MQLLYFPLHLHVHSFSLSHSVAPQLFILQFQPRQQHFQRNTHTQFMTNIFIQQQQQKQRKRERETTILILHNIEIANNIDDRPDRQTDSHTWKQQKTSNHRKIIWEIALGPSTSEHSHTQKQTKKTTVQYWLVLMFIRDCLPGHVSTVNNHYKLVWMPNNCRIEFFWVVLCRHFFL